MSFILALLGVLSVGRALPCLTSGSKNEFNKTRVALNDLKSLLRSTVTTLQGQINTINGKITALDTDLREIEDDVKKRQWMKYNDHCYFFEAEKVIWTTAERRCREIGGYLAKVDNANENVWILQTMMKAKKNTQFWLGMVDVLNGIWRWTYDETKPKYQSWASGCPHPANSTASKNRNCALISYSTAGKWYDYPCNSYEGYVCENNFYEDIELNTCCQSCFKWFR